MILKDEVIKYLEESRSHARASDAIHAAEVDGRVDVKALLNIVCLILDHLEDKE